VDVSVEGPVMAWKLENTVPPTIQIKPAANADNWSDITVRAATKKLKKGEKPDGYCEATTTLYCQAVAECECIGALPTIVPSGTTIDPGGSITAYVSSGELACPPFAWEVSGTGYSYSDPETDGDGEETTLSSAAGTCGVNYDPYTTMTVTDYCEEVDTQFIYNSGGTWGNESMECSDANFQNDDETWDYIDEAEKFVLRGTETAWDSNYVWDGACTGSETFDYCHDRCNDWLDVEGYSDCYTGTGCYAFHHIAMPGITYCNRMHPSTKVRVYINRVYHYDYVCP